MSFTVFGKNVKETSDLIDKAARISQVAMKKIEREAGRNPDKSVMAQKMLAAAFAATAGVYVDAIREEEEKEKLKNKEQEESQKNVEDEILATPLEMSPELKKMVDEMYKSMKSHEDVYPPPFPPGTLVVPIGGLAKCQCSPDCTKLLPEPAYRALNDAEKERWNLDSESQEDAEPTCYEEVVSMVKRQRRALEKKNKAKHGN